MAKINTVFSLTDNVTNPLRRMNGQISKTSGGFKDMAIKMMGVNQAIQLVTMSVNTFKKALSAMDKMVEIYSTQAEQELKLATVMEQRMNATKADIQAIKELASAQQKLGIYGDELILSGAQQLTTFVSNRKALETLIPAMNDLVAKQKGYKASVSDFQSVGLLFGKAMNGQVTALTRAGIILSDTEKQLLEYGNEEQRASALAKIITERVGHMNQALAGTDLGAIQNANNLLGDFYERMGDNLVSIQRAFKQIKTEIAIYFEQPLIKAINWTKQNIGNLISTIVKLGTVVTVVGATMAIDWAVANWPLTLAIALAVTYMRVLFDLTASANATATAMNGFGNQCAEAGNMFGQVVGFIAGTVNGLMNIIYNVIAVVYNALVYASEFILNIFTHPINTIARMFLDLANLTLQVFSTVAGVIDWVFNTSINKTLNKASKEIESFKENKFGNVSFEYQKMGLKDVSGIASAINAGGNIGKDLGTILDKKFAMPKFQMPEQQRLKTDSNGNLLVSDVNIVDITDDYRELLSKRATEKFNLQFSQVTPQVEIAGITVNNNTDLDSVIESIVDGVEEAQRTSLRS